jgi:acyl-CoA thioesterase FadM
VGKRSVVLKQEIFVKASMAPAADALVTFVIADRSGRAVAMSGALLAEIEKLR